MLPFHRPVVAALAAAVAVAVAPHAVHAQDAPKPVTRLTMDLKAVLPMLNTAVMRVRTPGEASDAKMTHLTGIRVGNDLVIVSVPDIDPAPTSYSVGVYDRWVPAPVAAKDESGLYALLQVGDLPGAAPTLIPAPVAPGFVVGAVSTGPILDIRQVWREPGEKIVDLPPGAAVFAVDGRFAGLTSAVDGGTIIIPGADVLASAEELRAKAKPADKPAAAAR
jgi:hypothetical protein